MHTNSDKVLTTQKKKKKKDNISVKPQKKLFVQ